MNVCLIITVKQLDRAVPNFAHRFCTQVHRGPEMVFRLLFRFLYIFFIGADFEWDWVGWGGAGRDLIFQKTWAELGNPKLKILNCGFIFMKAVSIVLRLNSCQNLKCRYNIQIVICELFDDCIRSSMDINSKSQARVY